MRRKYAYSDNCGRMKPARRAVHKNSLLITSFKDNCVVLTIQLTFG